MSEKHTTAADDVVSRPRHQAREMALQMLYQFDLGRSSEREILASFDPDEYRFDSDDESRPVGRRSARGAKRRQEAFEYAKRLVQGTLAHLDEIDGWIDQQAENWRLERMPAVDRSILRLAAFELAYEEDIPKVVILDEAIELAKRFGSEQSGSFVNGLLDALVRERHFPGTLT